MLEPRTVNDFLMISKQWPREWDRAALLDYLTAQGIAYEETLHQPVHTMAESATLGLTLSGSRCKNLFVQDKKGVQRFLVVTPPAASLDLGGLGRILGAGRLSLCPPDVMQSLLQVTPGSLSPLALVADCGAVKIRLLMDATLRTVSNFLFHPLDNISTICLCRDDLERFIQSTGHASEYVSMPTRPVVNDQ